jgi:uncharacterized membrane protein
VKLVDILQGKWLGHPLHPAIVHVPVGGWLVACALDVVTWCTHGGPALARLALWCVGLGLAGAIVAVAPGVADWSAIKREKPAWRIGLYHMLLNLVAALVWTVNFGLRWAQRDAVSAVITRPILLTAVVGALLVFVSAYLGSLLVYDHGIGVARMSKRKWRQLALRGGARVPEEK